MSIFCSFIYRGIFPLLVVALATSNFCYAQRAGDDLEEIRSVSSSNGVLDTVLTMEYANYNGAAHRFTNTRLMNGTLPGPTLRLKAGDKMRILFQNKLRDQGNDRGVGDNEYKYPDHSNLHFHGAHVTGELPSDDVRIKIAPGDSFQYETDFPSNHMPGTHWMHPHVHGSSALQVGGGAALVFIVEDPPNYLPEQVEEAKEVILMVQHMSLNTLGDIVDDIRDDIMQIRRPGTDSSVSQADYRLVNGQFQPTIDMRPGEWQRWRVVFGSWLRNPLNMEILGTRCEMQLLAKDGVYLNDYPREITMAPIPTGGRADIMVRCSRAGNYEVVDFDDEVILNLRVSGSSVDSDELEPWSPPLPDYLKSLRNERVDSDCNCRLRMHGGDSCPGRFCMNERPFDDNRYVHTIEYGEVVERLIENIGAHPYHQHVYPFEIQGNELARSNDISNAQKQYFKTGDWHDVLMVDDLDEDLRVRYKPDVFDGRVMLHCHRLNHEDRGMMAQEHIIRNGRCDCEAHSFSESPDPDQEADRNPITRAPQVTRPPEVTRPPVPVTSAPEPTAEQQPVDDPEGGFQLTPCVSGRMMVEVKDQMRPVKIEDLQIGDYVRIVSSNNDESLHYSRVYSFGHLNPNQRTLYLQLYFDDKSSPLEITDDHLLFVNNKAISASEVRVGDRVVSSSTTSKLVTKIDTIALRGAYAPFTYDGTALINGVSVSNYVNMHTTDVKFQHWLSHAFLAPRRWYCSTFFWNQCAKETYTNSEGIADYLYGSYQLVTSMEEELPAIPMMEIMTPFFSRIVQACMIAMSLIWYALDRIFVAAANIASFSGIFFLLSSVAFICATKITTNVRKEKTL